MNKLLIVVGCLVILVIIVIVNGFVVSQLWDWLIVPVFSLPALSISEAAGTSLVVSYLTHSPDTSKADTDRVKAWTVAIAKPLLALAIGYVLTFYL